MNGLKCIAALACVLAAGCASAPERTSRSVPAEPAATLAAAGGAGEGGIAADSPLAADGAIAAQSETETPVADLQPADGAVVTCRELLQPASNTIVKRCASRDDWKTYDRAVELWSQQQLGLWRGSPYRF